MNSLKYSPSDFHQSLKEIPWYCCKTYHSTAKALGVSLNTVQQMLLQQDVCHVHTSSLKPTLTDENKVSRMELALSLINKNNTTNSRAWRISFTSTRNGFISQWMDNTLSLRQMRLNPTGMLSSQAVLDEDHVPMCGGKT